MTHTDGATLERIAARYPALAAAVETQVTLMLTAVLPAADGAIATEGQLDALLESVVSRVVARSDQTRSDPPPLELLRVVHHREHGGRGLVADAAAEGGRDACPGSHCRARLRWGYW